MTNLEGTTVLLRAVEPTDIDPMYAWENDPAVWRVSGTTAPFSRHTLERFVEEQRYDIFQTRQQRLVIETREDARIVGALDLFELDPLNARAGLGVLIHRTDDRGRGYASDAVEVACRYARTTLRMHQLWCGVGADNAASLALFRKAGFTQTGMKRDWLWTPDGYRDEAMLQKILE